MKRYFWPIFFALQLAAQAPPKPPAPPASVDAKSVAAPVISDALKLRYFKAQAEYSQAHEVADRATTTANQKMTVARDVAVEIGKVCGDNYAPQVNADDDPVCVAKPPAPKK